MKSGGFHRKDGKNDKIILGGLPEARPCFPRESEPKKGGSGLAEKGGCRERLSPIIGPDRDNGKGIPYHIWGSIRRGGLFLEGIDCGSKKRSKKGARRSSLVSNLAEDNVCDVKGIAGQKGRGLLRKLPCAQLLGEGKSNQGECWSETEEALAIKKKEKGNKGPSSPERKLLDALILNRKEILEDCRGEGKSPRTGLKEGMTLF